MADAEVLSGNSGGMDLGINTGTVELVNGEHWVRIAFEVGIMGAKLDMPVNEARTLIDTMPTMLQSAIDEAEKRNAVRDELKATVLSVVEQYKDEEK
jgi:hypothetical protein